MKTESIILLVVVLAVLFSVFVNRADNKFKETTGGSTVLLEDVKTTDLIDDRGIANKQVSDFPYPDTTSTSKELSTNHLNNISNAVNQPDQELTDKKDTIVEKRTGPPVKSETRVPTYYRKDNMSGSTIKSSEYKFAEVDNLKSSHAWSDENVSQYPNFYTSDVKNELTNIGQFFDTNNQYADTTYPKSTANVDDVCYISKEGTKVCLDNKRLHNTPPSLITDKNNCGFLNSIGLLEFSNQIYETKERVINGGYLYGQVQGSVKHNERYSAPIRKQSLRCTI